ncbi:ichor-like [Euwallacea fornicatus]|uniref:ichor-like n=1 Tax=Euwallacea fornicatus TaxID=995702 RepID=UPI0033902562
MKTMKYPNLSGSNMAVSGSGSVDEVDSIFTSPCWQNSSSSEFIDHKLILDGAISNLGSDKLLLDASIQDENEIETKATMDALDNLLSSSQPMSLAELKPLPPFTGYTANLSINGIQGHHYHTISQRIPEENNNYSNYNEHNIVSSSTCNIGSDSGDEKTLYTVDEVVKLGYADCVSADSSAIKFEDCSHASLDSTGVQIKTEIAEYDISSIDDIAAIIGSAIADTTVSNNNNNPESDDPNASRDSWMDLDAWIDQTCGEQKNAIIHQEGMSEFLVPNTSSEYTKSQNTIEYGTNTKVQSPGQGGSTLHSLLTQGNMPLLQYRLQNGPPIKHESPSSTNYNADLIPTSSPPANVVSTTENLLLTVNGRFIPQYSIHGMHDDHRIRSPELMGQNYPHTTTTTPNTKKSRSRAQKKQQAASSTVFSTDQTLGLLGKEKPVHRCSICNRGFLNKSNIKVHLRTHTGEKPFRCDTCAKAFRQKAHLLKHQQIHKRIGRD